MPVTTVHVADDHPLMLQAITNLIQSIPGMEIVSSAQNGAEALLNISRDKPDIAIIDLDMPLMQGLDVVRAARQADLATKFIVLTFHKEKSLVQKAIELDVLGYLIKEDSPAEIVECIQHVRNGRQYISNAILMESDPTDILLSSLTDTEQKILRLISDGHNSQRIAELLFVAVKTIENHRSNICRKLNLDGRHNSLVKWALENKDRL